MSSLSPSTRRGIGPLNPREVRQCHGKVPLPSMERALSEAKRLHKKLKARFNAYVCPHCGAFHVGHDRSLAAAIRHSERKGRLK